MNDTIAAIATPTGMGGIAIIRVSGELVPEIAKKVFSRKLKDHIFTHGMILNHDGTELDEGMAVIMLSPRSYTKENVLELNCHAGIYVARAALESCIAAGARPAKPGEFTQRAFLNGRIDLTQAQAVMDIIHAQSEASARAALSRMRGGLSREIKVIENKLIDEAARLEAFLDYPDEDLAQVTAQNVLDNLQPIVKKLEDALKTAPAARKIREGVKVAIIGAPNAGKSSLLNALLRDERAIVSSIPGTTRDTLSEHMQIEGQLFVLTDTAGLRTTDDIIEREGISRAKRCIDEADILILCADNQRSAPMEVMKYINDTRAIVVINKTDLPGVVTNINAQPALEISALHNINIDTLRNELIKRAETSLSSAAQLTHEHDEHAVKETLLALYSACETLQKGLLDCAALDMRTAISTLSEMTGTNEQAVIERMFSKYCLGK